MSEQEYFNVADIFGENVFNDAVMQERLPKKVYKKLHEVMDEGKELDLETADVIAHEMKEWAIEKGATHYTHWFQPLTGVTAEKHDSFITSPMPNGKVLMSFSGKELIKGEPDASSFPSGGLRATFEARGYTAWDCTSPAFVRQDAAGATLCIPTAFCSYTGEALDQKTPLLRSMEAINDQALRLLRLFGNTTSKKVTPSVGPEQEYFIVDREKYLQRKDLIFTGRTLFGAMPPKGQEMDDHYFGAIRERIAAYMRDVNKELWKLGVSAKTQHNEVAPAQHELAPIYAECNVAVDHNQLIMETLKKVAGRHGLQCLLHEKPFAGVNGSGKHDNWSAEAFSDACDILEKADNFDLAVHDLIKDYAVEHQRIVFNGNGYSDEWVAEAERRGLPNIKSMVDAIPAYVAPESVAAFEKFGVFTKTELESRAEIEYETYAKTINIEAKAMIDIAGKQIIPAVIKYVTSLAQSVNSVKSAVADADVSVQSELLTESSALLSDAQVALAKLKDETAKAGAMEEGREQAVYYRDVVKTAMDALRTPVDELEMIVDKEMWPMPSYGDLIFEV